MSDFDFELECARRLDRLRRILCEVHNERRISILKAFSKWVGEASEKFKSDYARDCTRFKDAYADLETSRDSWVNAWVAAVDIHNRRVRDLAIKSLQNELDYYIDAVIDEFLENTSPYNKMPKTARNIVRTSIKVGDDAIDILPGDLSILSDDAEELVPRPREVEAMDWRPSPPDYSIVDVFVRYERKSIVNPTLGMYDLYSTQPST